MHTFIIRSCWIVLISMWCCMPILAQQNCMNAIPICQNVYSQTNANTGVGSVADLTSSNQGCLTNGEVNSGWYILNASTAGNVIFTITPNNATDDYDFAVWDITDTSCNALANGLTPLRCNFASLANSSPGGLTGLNSTATQTSIGGGGPSFCSAITAVAGQTFVILVNNNSGSANGYAINFTGSTAQIIDNTSPTVKSVYVPPTCGGPMQVKVLLKENVKCNSIANNGSDFTVSGGYAINGAVGSSCASGGVFSSSIFINFNAALSPGTYTVTINNGTDGNTLLDNCNNALMAGSTFTFTVLTPLQAIVQPQFGCSGSTSGTITASGLGGYLPYKYAINGGIFNIGNTFASLSAGTYTVSIKDSLGCIDDSVITLSPAPPIVINSASSTNLSCFSAANGTITINASGGSAPLVYGANSLPYGTSNILTGLGPGTYVVHTKDANGCIKDTIILITSPGALLGTNVAVSNVTCLGLTNGSINYAANGGTLPLQYALDAGTYSSFANYPNLAPGTYTIHIKDANNCIKDTIISIVQPSTVLSASIASVVQPNCSGTAGAINGAGAGGTAPYTYSINGTTYNASSSFTNLSSGTYTIYVKDAGGCVATVTSLLSSPGNINYTGATIVQPTCVTNASITVTASGGTPPLTFAIGAGAFSSNNAFTGLVAGSYTLHVKDNNNCTHDTIITLVQLSIPQIAISTFTNASCSSPNSGSIAVVSTSGTGVKTYSINGGAFTSAASFSSLAAGSYTIVVKDVNGCTSFATATIVSNNTVAFATVTATNVGCSGTPLATITVSGVGGNLPYQYKINTNAFQSVGTFTNLNGGTYTITVQDASGCSKTTLVTVQSSVGFSLTAFTKVNATCTNPGNGTISATVIGGIAPIVYNLNGTNYAGSNYNGLAPGTYTFTATDANGCSVSSTTIITGPPPLWFINTLVVLPPCYGGFGSISANGTGGLAPYTFSLNTNAYASTANYTNLPAGNYTIHLKDANGCIHDTIINLIQPNPVLANNLNVSNASCGGAATGSVSVTGGGTAGPYQYNINGGAWGATNIFTGLGVGSYTIGVKDANACTAAIIASINNNGNFYFGSSSIVNPLCVGAGNGSITFSGSGGATPYTYKMNGGTYQPANTFTGIAAGAYTLYVKDNAGCIVSQVINMPNPNPLQYNSIFINPPLCNNDSNAIVTVAGSGGSGVITYRLDAGTYQATGSFTSLLAGIHTLTIKDANGCMMDSIINISNPSPTAFSNIAITNPGCFGPGNGSIAITGNGGALPYSYQINTNGYSANNNFNPLLAGTYTLCIKDANNCTNSTTVVLLNSVGVNFSQLQKVLPQCKNSSNGSLTITATSLNPPLNYSINGGATNTTGLFTGLATGTFSIHAADAAGCYKDSIVTLIAQSNLRLDSASYTSTLCFGDSSGAAVLYASGGNGNLTYAYNTSAYITSNLLVGLTNTTYTLHVKDAIGCIVDTIITINAPPLLYFSNSIITNPYCNGSQDGSIAIFAGGGTMPYQYSINTNPFSTTTNYTNLIQSNYTFHIQDANGCHHDTTIFLMGPDIVYFSAFSITNITCFGASDGTISATANGGLAPYQYALNNNPFSTSNQFTSLPAGQYTLNAIDNQGCLIDTIIIITAPVSNIAINVINIVNNKCRGDSTGSIQVGGLGGTLPYTYLFNNTSTYSASSQYNNLPASTYTVFVKDANGCTNDSAIDVIEPDSSAQIFLISSTKNSCIGVYDATLTVSAKNGLRPYNYFLNGISQLKDSMFDGLIPGDFVVEVIDSIGCRSTGKYFIDSSTRKPNIILTDIKNNICKYDIIGQSAWTYNNVYYPVTAIVNQDTIFSDTSIQYLNNGNYVLHIVDDKGCKADTSFTISYTNSMEIAVTATDASCSGAGDDGKVSVEAKNGTAPYTFNWSLPQPSNLSAIDKIVYGAYSIVVVDNEGCIDSANFIIAYYPCCTIWMPNVFSPNHDGLNDNVILKPSGPVSFENLSIYNRWGIKVFETNNYNTLWDGKYLEQDCDMDTYFFIMRYTCPLSKRTLIKKGDITLIR